MKTIISILLMLAIAASVYLVFREKGPGVMAKNIEEKKLSSAVFAGGCFWCTESDFEGVEGVVEVISGYTGGSVPNPTYEAVCGGGTGHAEAVNVLYDSSKVSYGELLDRFWKVVDPTDGGGQFVDRGSQYRSGIFYVDEEQRLLAEESRAELIKSGRFKEPIVTEITKLEEFYPAEEYHQDYYKKNSFHYKMYRRGSGRDRFLQCVWNGGER